MKKNEFVGLNLIKSEDIKKNKYIFLEEKQDIKQFMSKTEYQYFNKKIHSQDRNKMSNESMATEPPPIISRL